MIVVHDETGRLQKTWEQLLIAAAQSTLAHEGHRGSMQMQVVEQEAMRLLNKEQRGMDNVTDVLSFPSSPPGELPPDGYYGDIVICLPRALEQAEAYRHSEERELAFLAVHGALHLFGYDHGEPAEEARMRNAQKQILERMGLSV